MAASKLHAAVRQDKCRLISKLVSEGTPVDGLDGNGDTPLFVALRDGPVSAVPYLLQAGANPNFRCNGNATPVHAACRRGSRHIVQLLLECGGDLRLRDDRGRTPQDWALEHADPQYRRKLVTFINTRRAIAYRFEDPTVVLEDDPSAADVSGGATTSIRWRFGRGKKLWCTERLKPDGGFGVVYCSPSRETGTSTLLPFVSSMYLYNSEDGSSIWCGPQSVIQNMYWEKLKVSVKKSSLNSSNTRAPCSDILITELEKIRKLTCHPYFLWPLAVSPVQNMDDVMLVFECIHYGSVFDALHNNTPETYSGPMNRNQLALVLQQACEALLFLHSRKWVHGCVSSHCIYVITPYLGKLGGFEFVCPSEEISGYKAPYSPLGEDFLDYYYHWMAPEVLSGQRPTRAADLYQFCAVLWEVFSEQVPWDTLERSSVFRRLVQEKTGLGHCPDIPSPLDVLVRAGLAPDPLERDTELDEVYQALAGLVQESFSNMGFLTNRTADVSRIKTAPGRNVHSRQTSINEMTDHGSFIQQQKGASRKQSPMMLDDISEAFDDLISLADEERPKTPQRRRMADALCGPKFDEISISSSLDPMDFAYARDSRVPTFSCQHGKASFEAFTQTEKSSRPPTARPRTRAFGASSSSNIKLASRYTDTVLANNNMETTMTAQRSEETGATAAGKEPLQSKAQRPIGFVAQPSGRRPVRPCKPASHSYGLSPFMQPSRTQRIVPDTATMESGSKPTDVGKHLGGSSQTMGKMRSSFTEGKFRLGSSFVSRGAYLRKAEAVILEDLEEDQAARGAGEVLQEETQTIPKQTLRAETRTPKGAADYSLPSMLMAGEEGDTTDNEVKSVQTEPNHAYKVEVVTMTCPVVQHTLTVTSTNLLTGECVVTEESTGAEMVQVQWNPDENNINISTPDTSFQSPGQSVSQNTSQ